MTGWNLPPGCTDADIDRACPGYYDEPDKDEPELHECESCGRMKPIERIEERACNGVLVLICDLCLDEGWPFRP